MEPVAVSPLGTFLLDYHIRIRSISNLIPLLKEVVSVMELVLVMGFAVVNSASAVKESSTARD